MFTGYSLTIVRPVGLNKNEASHTCKCDPRNNGGKSMMRVRAEDYGAKKQFILDRGGAVRPKGL
jgi:hypothetical protein